MSRNGAQRIFGRITEPLWLRALLFSVAYFTCAEAGRYLSARGGTYVSFWLPAGLYVAVLLLNDQRAWPWLILGALVGNFAFDLLHDTKPVIIFLFFCANTVQSGLGAWLTKRFVAKRPTLSTLKEFVGLLGFAAILGTMVGAVIGAGTLVHFGLSNSFAESWKVWWGSCAMAVLFLSPFLLTWLKKSSAPQRGTPPRKKIIEGALLFGGMTWLIWFTLVAETHAGILSAHNARVIPFLLWAGLRFGIRGAAAANLLVALLFTFLTTHFLKGLTPEDISSGEYVFILQTNLVVAALVTWIPAIVLAERDRTLTELRASEESLRATIENTPNVAVQWYDAAGRVLFWNPASEVMFGWKADDALGKTLDQLIHTPEEAAGFVKVLEEIERTGKPTGPNEYRFRRRDGAARVCLSTIFRIPFAAGKSYFVCMDVDVTERQQAEEALRRNELLFRAIVEDQTEMIVRWKPDGTRTFVNQAYCRVFGGKPSDHLGTSFFPLIAPEYLEMIRQKILSLTPENPIATSVHRSISADGATHWQEWSDRGIFDTAGRLVELQSTGRDITERKQAEEQINLLQMITMDVVTAHDLSSALTVVLRRVCEKTGWALGQAWIPKPDGTALDCCPGWFAATGDMDEFRNASSCAGFPPGTGLPGRVWKSRQPVWVSDVTLDQNFPRAAVARKIGLKAGLGVPILSGDKVIAVLEFFLREPRSEDERLVKVISAVATQIDLVIERKRAEQSLRESEAERTEALRREQRAREEFTQQLIASQEAERQRIAGELHDSLAQNLSIIKNRARLAADEPATSETTALHLQAIERVVSETIAETRSLAHNLRPLHIEQVGLTDSLQGLIREVSQSCQTHFEQRLENVDDIFKAEAATNVFRVVQEALNNLVKHSGARHASVTLERDVRAVRLRVVDDGVGFETSVATRRGGLGLTSMSERVRMLGGKLQIQSAPGKGTELIVELPFDDLG